MIDNLDADIYGAPDDGFAEGPREEGQFAEYYVWWYPFKDVPDKLRGEVVQEGPRGGHSVGWKCGGKRGGMPAGTLGFIQRGRSTDLRLDIQPVAEPSSDPGPCPPATHRGLLLSFFSRSPL